MYTVNVEYDGGLNKATEDRINKAAGYTFDNDVKCDSGCILHEPFTRDITFTYPTAERAIHAAGAIRQIHGVRVKTELVS